MDLLKSLYSLQVLNARFGVWLSVMCRVCICAYIAMAASALGNGLVVRCTPLVLCKCLVVVYCVCVAKSVKVNQTRNKEIKKCVDKETTMHTLESAQRGERVGRYTG